MNLYSFFINNFNPKKKLIFDKKIYLYKDFLSAIEKVSVYLSNFSKEKKILLFSNNPYYLGVFFYSCAKLGKVLIPLNKALKKKQIIDQIKISKPDIIVYSEQFKNIFNKITGVKLINEDNIFIKSKINKKTKKEIIKNHINKDFIITFSSGTTSDPKPILFTQKIKFLRFKHIKNLYKVNKEDNILSTSPLDHSLGQRLFFLATLTSNNFVYLSKYNLKILKRLISEQKISFTILPSNYLFLLEKYLLNKTIKIKKIVSAASSIDISDKILFKKNKINFNEMYGTSEIGTITNLSEKDSTKKNYSVGKVLRGSDVKILDKRGRVLKAFKVGEIACKTKLEFKEYYNNRALTNKSKKRGYFLTGDLGYLDRNNYLYFVSRKKDLIISSGINIYPIDIEKALNKHNNIVESAIIGIKDKFFGEAVFAICVLKKKINKFELILREYLSTKLASYQLPIGYEFVKKIPKNSLGKILKKDLKKTFERKKLDLSRNLRSLLN